MLHDAPPDSSSLEVAMCSRDIFWQVGHAMLPDRPISAGWAFSHARRACSSQKGYAVMRDVFNLLFKVIEALQSFSGALHLQRQTLSIRLPCASEIFYRKSVPACDLMQARYCFSPSLVMDATCSCMVIKQLVLLQCFRCSRPSGSIHEVGETEDK